MTSPARPDSELHALCRAADPARTWVGLAPQPLEPLRAPGLPLTPLLRALRRAERPLLVVNDSARVQLELLPEVLGELWEAARERPILVATGTHAEDLARMRDRLGGLPCELHQTDDADSHGPCGPGRLDRRLLEADLVVAFGSVEPHYFAGWAGAHKTATIGVADRATISANHRGALSAGARPLATEGNPVFAGIRELLAALEQGRRLLAVNHVLDEGGRPLGVGVGTWRGSLQRALRAAEQRFVTPRPRPSSLVVARPRGPLGASLYQADKALKNHEAIVADGGDLILFAPDLVASGPARFLALLRAAPDHASALAEVERAGYVLGDHKAVRLRALEGRGVTIHLVAPQLDPAPLAGTGLRAYPSLEAALAQVPRPEAAAAEALAIDDAGLLVTTLRGR